MARAAWNVPESSAPVSSLLDVMSEELAHDLHNK
jgi:hypothetical protein